MRAPIRTANGKLFDDNKLVFDDLKNSLNDHHRVLLEISIKIHSFLNHSTEEDEEQKAEEDVSLTEDNAPSKFVNEMDSGPQTGDQNTKMDGLDACLKGCDVSKKQRMVNSNWMIAEQFDTDALEQDLGAMTSALKEER